MQGNALARGIDCSAPGVLYQKLKPGPGKDAVQVAGHQRARIHSAMLELVAENGYEAVTVRELARAAGVSTRSFYKHYSSKEQCFLRVLQLVIQRVLHLSDFPRECTTDERIQLSIERMVGALASDPRAARLLCVDAYTAGPVALKHAESARRSMEMAIDEGFGAEHNVLRPSLVAEAIVAGVYSAIRSHQLEERELSSAYLRETLVPWMIACCEGFLQLDELSRVRSPEEIAFDPAFGEIPNRNQHVGEIGSSKGDRTALLRVAVKLATNENYQTLTLAKLVKAAGVSRRTFDANFSSQEECVLRALELNAVDAVTRAREASQSGLVPEEGTYRAVATLCRQVEVDKPLASLCLDPSVAPGVPKMRFQQTMIDELASTVADQLEAAWRVDRSIVRVSVGSIWGVIQNQATSGKARGLFRETPTLTYLLLAPIIGPTAAMGTVNQEHALTT